MAAVTKKVRKETHFITLKLPEHKSYDLENSISLDEHLCQNLQRECGYYCMIIVLLLLLCEFVVIII